MSRTYPIPFLDRLMPPDIVPGEQAVAYLAGPMRGYELHNFPAFAEAALILRRHGWQIESPAEYDLAAGVDPAGTEQDWPITVREMLRTDFRLILERCNAIILMEGWHNSKGAQMEALIANAIGLPMFELRQTKDSWAIERLHVEDHTVEFTFNEEPPLIHRTVRDGVVSETRVKL